MKKKNFYILSIIFLLLTGCAGYEPIFGSKNLDFKISNYTIEGDEKLGNKIYSKLHSLTKKNNEGPDTKSIDVLINITKDKVATAKDSAGKILEYKITLYSIIDIKNYLTEEKFFSKKTLQSEDFDIKFSDLINQIQKNAPIQFILRDKDDYEILSIFEEIIEELDKIKLKDKIESLEQKVSLNLDEKLYSELLSLRTQLKEG